MEGTPMGRWTAAFVLLVAFGSIAYRAGQLSGASAHAAPQAAVPAQFTMPREVIPVPTPARPGQTPGQSQDCQPVILFYYNGKLYQLMPRGAHVPSQFSGHELRHGGRDHVCGHRIEHG